MLPPADAEKPADTEMKIAVVGRANTGKSTLINTLAHAERMIVSERPGTTRDSVDVHFELDNLTFLAIDTAGIKRSSKIRDNLDFYSFHRAQRSIRRADVVLLFIDPTQGITRLDKQLADYISQEHKPCIFTINKWDLMQKDPADPTMGNMGRYANLVQHSFRSMSYMPLAFITAQTGRNVKALVNLAQSLFKQSRNRVGTGTLNRILREAVDAHPPASRENRTPRIYYATQVGVTPPTVVLFVNSTSSSTQPISAICSMSFARNCRFATFPSSSTCDRADKPRKARAPRPINGEGPADTAQSEPGTVTPCTLPARGISTWRAVFLIAKLTSCFPISISQVARARNRTPIQCSRCFLAWTCCTRILRSVRSRQRPAGRLAPFAGPNGRAALIIANESGRMALAKVMTCGHSDELQRPKGCGGRADDRRRTQRDQV